MARKKAKINEKKEEIPSFLLDLKNTSDNAKVLSKPEKNVLHLGPIFFGCHQYHPQPHSIKLGSFHHTQYTASSKEDILSGMFLPKSTVEKFHEVRKPFRPARKFRQKIFNDFYSHKCPGTLKVFKPKISPPVIDVGESGSVIEAETSREIPLYWNNGISSNTLKTEFELVTFSDLWEKERKKNLLPYKERMAHIHFPKEIVTVRMIGPPIPGAITITKLPSKRKTDSEIDLHLLANRKSTENDDERTEKKKVEVRPEDVIEESPFAADEEVSPNEETEINDDKEDESIDVIEEDDFERVSDENLSESDKRNEEKKQKSVMFDDEENIDKEEMGMESSLKEEEGTEKPDEEMSEE